MKHLRLIQLGLWLKLAAKKVGGLLNDYRGPAITRIDEGTPNEYNVHMFVIVQPTYPCNEIKLDVDFTLPL
jgi:hypothetical protein